VLVLRELGPLRVPQVDGDIYREEVEQVDGDKSESRQIWSGAAEYFQTPASLVMEGRQRELKLPSHQLFCCIRGA
jgi:hypothetical protein